MFHFRTTLFALLATTFSLHVAAQPAATDKVKVKVRISGDQDADARIMPYSIIRSSPTSIMMLRSPEFDVRAFTKLTPRLDLYDREKLTYIRSMEPVMQRLHQEKLLLEDLVLFNKKPMLVARGGGDQEVVLYTQYVDPHLTKQPPAFDRLCSFPVQVKEHRAVIVQAGSATREPWYTAFSPDSTRMLIHSPELKDTDDGGAFILLAMVNKDLTVEWQHILRLSDKYNRTEALDVEIDNNGTAFLLVKNRFKGREIKGDIVNFEVMLHKVNANDITETPFPFDAGYYPTGGILQTLTDGRVACVGIYAQVEGRKLLGNFIAFLHADSASMGFPQLMPFSGEGDLNEELAEEEVVNEKEEKKEEEDATKAEQKDKKRMNANTDVIAILPRVNGGFYLVNEVNYSAVYTNMQSGRRDQRFYHGPVQARCFEKDGTEKWSTIFRRWTVSGSPILGRVFPAEFNDQLYLFLWDSEEMAERRKEGLRIAPKHAGSPYSAYTVFDEKGGYRTKAVLKNDSDEDFISGWNLVRTGRDEYIALGTEKLVSGKFLPVRIDFIKETKK
ncbi:MAG: hypothetical protein IPG92_06295 [Flavobacteriales bacterium]|nr:hypothetical protein [Flavobacteriales bacterium]